MNKDAEYITQEKYDLLVGELNELKTIKRKEVLETLEFARSLGDLSENAEYHQAREDQGKLEDRIQKIEYILRTAKIVPEGGHGDVIEVGSVVELEKENTKEKIIYTIVGSEEADTLSGKISNKSPLGEALFGKKKGDVAKINTPKGEVVYKIKSIK